MRFIIYLALGALLWWALTDAAQAWYVGVPVIVLATCLALRLHPPRTATIVWWRLPVFIGFFLKQSLKAGFDVAWRTLRITPAVNPGTVRYLSCLPDGSARYFLGAVIGLFPGTLCTDFEGDYLLIHTLDTNVDVTPVCSAVEQHIARLFGIRTQSGEATG